MHSKWMERKSDSKVQVHLGLDDLKMLRLWENDDQELRDPENMGGIKEELTKDVIDTITTARVDDPVLKKCANRETKEKWGSR
jgi:hypothetical protein